MFSLSFYFFTFMSLLAIINQTNIIIFLYQSNTLPLCCCYHCCRCQYGYSTFYCCLQMPLSSCVSMYFSRTDRCCSIITYAAIQCTYICMQILARTTVNLYVSLRSSNIGKPHHQNTTQYGNPNKNRFSVCTTNSTVHSNPYTYRRGRN